MTLHLLRIFRFSIVTVILATFTVLFLRGRDPAFLNFHKRSPAEIALSRVIKRVNFQGVPFYQAIDTLSQAAGIKIECDAAAKSTEAYTKDIYASDDQITLREALRQLIVSEGEPLLYFPDGDRIRIGFASPPAEPVYMDEYSLPGFTMGDDHIQGLYMLTAGNDAANSFEFDSVRPPRLFAVQSASWHRRYHELFDALRPGASAASRRMLPRGTEVLDFVNGAFHPRVGRAADDALGAVLSAVSIPRQPLTKALAILSAQAGVRIGVGHNAVATLSNVQLDATNITLDAVLQNLLSQVSKIDGVLPDRDTIWIGAEADPILFRIYDLNLTYCSSCSEEERSERALGLRASLSRNGTGKPLDVGFLGSMLVVRGNWQELELGEKSLLQCLNASSDPNHATTSP